jgi:Asp-tRNA(Asn)/Glu-tRNA(Gln) amidotransferase A subunit family amidase
MSANCRTLIRSRGNKTAALLLWLAALIAAPVTQATVQHHLAQSDILALQLAMGSGRLTSRVLVEHYLARIEQLNSGPLGLNAVRQLNPEALQRADALDAERRAKGPRGPLHGIPLLIKDNLQTRGMTTTAGSILLQDFQPEADAYQVSRLRAAGAIILGKTTMHEFGFGITGQGSLFGSSRNPYALQRNPADGAAAAVAADLATAALGSDSCGGLRAAAAHNSLVTLRGTQGLSSRAGAVPVSHTQDMVGPLARTVTDLALLLDATVGFDPQDRQSALSLGRIPPSYTEALNVLGLRDKRIGIVEDLLLVDPEDSAVVAVFGAAIAQLQAAGAQLERIRAPELVALMDSRVDGFFVLAHDFRTDITRYLRDNDHPDIDNLDDIIRRGEHHASIDDALRLAQAMEENSEQEYLAELEHRRQFREVVLALMARYELDALAYPAMRRIAALVDAPQPGSNCRLAANTGLPAVTVPAGFTPEGLPVGLELLGPSWSETSLLNMAYSFEQVTGHRRLPELIQPEPESAADSDTDKPLERVP